MSRTARRHHARRAAVLRPRGARCAERRDLQRHQWLCPQSRSEHRPHRLAHHQHAVVAQRLPVHARRNPELAEGQPQHHHRRRRVPGPRVGGLAAADDRHRHRFRHHQRSGGGAVHGGQLPGRVGGAADRCARALCAAHGPRHRRDRPGRARSGDQQIRQPRPAPPRGQARRVLGVRPGLVARDADADAQRRRALGRADAVLAVERHHDDGEPGRHLRRVGHRQRRHLRRLQFLRARRERRQGAGVHRSSRPARAATTPTGTTSRRTSALRGGRASRAAGCATLLGDPEQATMRGGYSEAFERQGIGGFTGIYGPNPGSTLSLTRNASTGIVGPARPGRCCCARPDRLYPAPFPGNADVPDSDPAEPRRQHQRLPSRHRGGVGAIVDRGLQRALDQGHGARSALRRHEGRQPVVDAQLQRAQCRWRTASSTSSSGRWRTCAPTTPPAAAAPDRLRTSVPGTGTNPLPIYLAYLNGRRDADNPAAYTGGAATWTNATFAGGWSHQSESELRQRQTVTAPTPNANAAGDLDNNLTFRNNALAAGLPANFFVVNPHAEHGQRPRQRRVQHLSRDAARAAAPALARACRSTAAISTRSRKGRSSSASISAAPRACERQHPSRDQGAVGLDRFRSATTSASAAACRRAEAIIGDWQFNGAGRFQQRTTSFGNVRLVGMTKAGSAEAVQVRRSATIRRPGCRRCSCSPTM